MDDGTRALLDDLAAAVTDIYTDVETYLLEHLAWRMEQDRTIWDLDTARLALVRDLRRETESLVADLRALSPGLADSIVERAAQRGAWGIRRELGAYLPATRFGDWLDPAHLFGVASTAFDLTSRWEAVHDRILRFPDDVHRRFGADIVAGKLTGQEHTIAYQRETLARWYGRGMPTFVDRGGRAWSPGAYVEMVTRTGVQRALTNGRAAQLSTAGLNLGIVQEVPGCCEHCARWAGRVIALDNTPVGRRTAASMLDGTPISFEVHGTIEEARADGWQHPNCRGTIGAYLPGVTRLGEFVQDYDEVEYEAEQELRATERDIRAAKRALAINPADTEARTDLAEARARARAITSEHAVNRKPQRESLAWSSPPRPHERRRRPTRPRIALPDGVALPTIQRSTRGDPR